MSLAGARPYLCRAIIVGAAASNQTERGGLFLSILSYMWSSIPKPLLSRAGRYLGPSRSTGQAPEVPLPLSSCRVSLDKYTRISEEQANKLFLCPGIQVRIQSGHNHLSCVVDISLMPSSSSFSIRCV